MMKKNDDIHIDLICKRSRYTGEQSTSELVETELRQALVGRALHR